MQRCWRGFREVAEGRCIGSGGSLLALDGEADRVHLLITLPLKLAPSNFVNNLKTTCFRLLGEELADKVNRVYRNPVFWSGSDCIISCRGRRSRA